MKSSTSASGASKRDSESFFTRGNVKNPRGTRSWLHKVDALAVAVFAEYMPQSQIATLDAARIENSPLELSKNESYQRQVVFEI